MQSRTLRGIGAAPGIASGSVYRHEDRRLRIERKEGGDTQYELTCLSTALEQAREEVHRLGQRTRQQAGSAEAAIFEAHELFLNDPELLQQVRATIEEQSTSAAYAWQEATRQYIEQLRTLGDDYLAARAIDLEDVAQRVLRALRKEEKRSIHLVEPAVIVAHDLTPSDTIQFDREMVRAFCTAAGGPTSHVAILAKALGLPAITGLGTAIEQLHNGDQVIVDGNKGEIFLNPDPALLAHYKELSEKQTRLEHEAWDAAHQPATTIDGTTIEIVANSGDGQVAEALTYGAEGIGLLRTEFLFLERERAPGEDEQAAIYRAILETMGMRPVVARTFDIGGDKPLPYLPMPAEMNPFLGLRGSRLALAQPELLQVQLRALLKAGHGHNLKIMFPMVTGIDEIHALRAHVRQAQDELASHGIEYARDIEIGIMVEVPAAALLADALAEQVDFFSIGTNDLTQYTLAVDRGNSAVATLADALHPAVLRLIHFTTEAAHRHGKWVGLCGELAGDPLATPVLLGLGLDELSMNARAIPVIKQQIRQYRMDEARAIAQHALKLSSASEVRKYLEDVKKRHGT